jgi:hypothetical protein
MYKEAARLQLRFVTTKGSLSTEQLWSLNQTELTNCIRNVKKSLKKNDDDELSFLDVNTKVDTVEQLRFDILKDVYLTKKAEAEAARNALQAKEHNQKIEFLIAEKKEAGLKDKSIEELEALLIK